MTKKTKLKLCDWILLVLTVFIFASGVQLEINPDGTRVWVWLHIAIGIFFISEILWHISLHKPSKNRVEIKNRNHRNRHPVMGIFFLLTLLSGVIATCHWIGFYHHSTIGGVHGKFGFLFIIAVIVHIVKHRRFYFL